MHFEMIEMGSSLATDTCQYLFAALAFQSFIFFCIILSCIIAQKVVWPSVFGWVRLMLNQLHRQKLSKKKISESSTEPCPLTAERKF